MTLPGASSPEISYEMTPVMNVQYVCYRTCCKFIILLHVHLYHTPPHCGSDTRDVTGTERSRACSRLVTRVRALSLNFTDRAASFSPKKKKKKNFFGLLAALVADESRRQLCNPLARTT